MAHKSYKLVQKHVSGNCWKDFQGQRSQVKVMTRPTNLQWRRHIFQR